MAVVRKTKTASKGAKTTSRPTTTKKTTSTRTTSAKATPKRATTTRTAAKPATRTRKPVTPTSTRTAKAANARATGKTTSTRSTKSTATTKKTATATKSRNVKTVAKPSAAPKTGPNRVIDELTGFAVGTDSQVIATELLKGGADRSEIIERCAKKLPPTSNRGTPKPVANMVASVLGKMKDQGYTIESTWVLTPPTRASKARATRERNKRLGK